MENKIYILMVSWTCCFLWSTGQETDQVRMTMLSINHFKSEEDSHYQCRMSPPDKDPSKITVESLRTGWTRKEGENPDPPDAEYQGGAHPYYRVNMTNNGNKNNAFGVFGCNATEEGKKETIISTTRMRSDADIVPRNDLFTQTVSIGDSDVSISMRITTDDFLVGELRWRNNTYMWDSKKYPSGFDKFTFDEPIQLYHAGIYECQRQGDRGSAKHGLNLLIVRACPFTTWGPPDCENVCHSCYNGGVCDENTGKCVCAPGFKGKNCLSACAGNRYGYDCEQKCSHSDDSQGKCGGTLFCLMHPFGCRCNTGFRGLDCKAVCDANRFGASCLQSCHCSFGACNRYTGECEGTDTSCDNGWTGASCQECVHGYFGSACDQECHCSSDKCNRESGLCQSGGCLPQWIDLFPPYSCQTGLEKATYTKVNPSITVPVNCTAVQGPGGDLTNLDIFLSRSSDDLDVKDITSIDTYSTETTNTSLFVVEGVVQDVELYCQLLDIGDAQVAVLVVNVELYDLPKLKTAPTEKNTSNTSVTVMWAAWNENNDDGDPPVVEYITYYKKESDDNWITGGDVNANKTLEYTFTELLSDTNYSFGVAAVREGAGGEGALSPPLDVKTICPVPLHGPQNVTANIAGDKQQLVEISWEHPFSDDIRCRGGVLMFKIYYSSTSLAPTDDDAVEITNSSATSYIIDGLVVGEEYVFYMTFTTEGGESRRSNQPLHLVPVLPKLSDPPTFAGRTSTTITVRWAAWDQTRDTGSPPVVSYRLYHKLSNDSESDWRGGISYIEDGRDYYFATVERLTPDTLYDFSVTTVRKGNGGEGEKSKPLQEQRTTCNDPLTGPQDVVTNISGDKQELVEISWELPPDDQIRCSDGVLHFNIYYSSTSNDEGGEEVSDPSATSFIIEGLERGEEYTFQMTLSTEGGKSSKSNEAQHLVPMLPSLKSDLTSKSGDADCNSVTVTWDTWTQGVDDGTPPVIGYIPYHRLSSEENKWILGDTVSHDPDKDKLEHTFFNLTEDESYDFAIAVVREGYGGEGDKNTYEQRTSKCRNVDAIVGTTVGVSLLIVLVIVLIILWMRRDSKRKAKNQRENYPGAINNAYSVEPGNSSTTSKNLPEDDDDAVYANVERPVPILLKDFENYVKASALEQQFLIFNSEPEFAADVGVTEANKKKNRFKNMIAYDHSRVVLPEKPNDPHSDYYNANYIKDSKGSVGFIAAQGPNKASVEDFWRMVWMENVSSIVMLTNLVENGKDRCFCYWPSTVGETTAFGRIKVTWQNSDQYANFEIRQYLITDEEKTHQVRNWHYKTWPDKDIPDQPSTLIEFAKRVKRGRKHATAPLLVHCSAGVGRTGTFIALCSLMDVLETSEKIDVFGFVAQMREDRVNMVQTAKQFKFLHDCLLEVYLAGDTFISVEKLTTFYVNSEGEKLGKEFKLLAKLDQMSQQVSSRAANESEKCRYPDIIPVEKKRPYLQSLGKNSSSNYINACSVMSYRKESSYIATQSPLPSTIEDFWRLVLDWKCPLIVMLNQLDNDDKTVCKYWPDAGSSQYGHITVELMEEQKESRYISRLFQIDHAHTQKPVSVHHLQLNSWDENKLWDIYSFIKDTEKLQQDFMMVEPTVIHCINGVGRTGIFIAVKSEMERIEAEEKVDVFTTVRQMRASSHHLVQTEEEYALCHQILKVNSPESTYANI